MSEHVLAVRAAQAQAPERGDEFLVDATHADGGDRVEARIDVALVRAGNRLGVLEFHAVRLNAAVLDERAQRHLRDLAALDVERRQLHRVDALLDDHVDAGERLERANIATLATDDAALHLLRRQLDPRHRRLRGRGTDLALHRLDKQLPRARVDILLYGALELAPLDQRFGLRVLREAAQAARPSLPPRTATATSARRRVRSFSSSGALVGEAALVARHHAHALVELARVLLMGALIRRDLLLTQGDSLLAALRLREHRARIFSRVFDLLSRGRADDGRLAPRKEDEQQGDQRGAKEQQNHHGGRTVVTARLPSAEASLVDTCLIGTLPVFHDCKRARWRVSLAREHAHHAPRAHLWCERCERVPPLARDLEHAIVDRVVNWLESGLDIVRLESLALELDADGARREPALRVPRARDLRGERRVVEQSHLDVARDERVSELRVNVSRDQLLAQLRARTCGLRERSQGDLTRALGGVRRCRGGVLPPSASHL